MIKDLKQHLADAGFKSAIVAIQHLSDLQDSLAQLLQSGILSNDFYSEITSRYSLNWNFEPPAELPEAKSIIITAVPQPKVSVRFKLSNQTYSAIIPPTYFHDTDLKASDIISRHLNSDGFKTCYALLPAKRLAVCSGLAVYGKNNIAYINGWGSYFRMRSFFTEMPWATDNWQEPKMMDLCNKCQACVRRCPTHAITKDRFLIDGGRCLTYFNEGDNEFPKWIDPAWHNCIIGCMICQDVCPANKDKTNWTVPGEEFSEEETLMILKGIAKDKLPPETIEKLKKVYMLDSYDVLQRNLGVLISKTEKGQKDHKT